MLIAIPVIGGLTAWLSSRIHSRAPFWISLISLIINLGITFSVWLSQPVLLPAGEEKQWIIDFIHPWIPALGISIHLALDGLSLIMVTLTSILGMMAVISSWYGIRERIGFFYANLLFIEAGILGVFLSLDLFLFYFFWELMLVPMYFLISIWGHKNRVYAATKFFIFTQASGLLMLVSIIGLYFVHGNDTGTYTFDYMQLLGTRFSTESGLWLMSGFVIAFAVKLPAVPFHTWLADAHSEAPTAGSIILAGLLLKTGAYGLLRFVLPLFPEASSMIAYPAMIVGTISILYGAVLAFSQTDLKRLIAYTSISHMGFVLLGIFTFNILALQGAMIQIVAHGISTGMLFFLAGALQDRIHSRDLTQMGGMWTTAPRMGAAMLIFAVASLGLPGMGNFIGEFLVLLGAFSVNITISSLATLGLVAATVYAVWLMQTTFFGETQVSLTFPDLSAREIIVAAAMVILIIWIGLQPQTLLDRSNDSMSRLQQIMMNPTSEQTDVSLLDKEPGGVR
jgi:NADH-quinone oxidoreductase subunit M